MQGQNNWVQAMFSFMGFAVMTAFMLGIARRFIKATFPAGEKKSLPSAHHPGIRTDLMRKWYDKGVEAGRTDGWMDVENTMRQTLEAHPKIKDADDLIWTDIEGWEQTDHFSILYGSKMMADAEGDYDLYSDLKTEFWEGYFKGRMDIGIDIHKRARELVGKGSSSSPKTKIAKRYTRPYLTNWQYGGYSYVEEDPAKPEELWAHGMVDYADPENVIAIAEREELSEISLAGGFWKEIGYKGYGEKVSISEARRALAKARKHVLGSSSSFE